MKTGRNDPCPCGSGKKYKKCCLDADRAAAGDPLKTEAVRRQIQAAGTWEVDVVPFPGGIESDPRARLGSLLVVGAGFVLENEVLNRPSPEPESLAEILAEGVLAAARRVELPVPSRVRIRHPELAPVVRKLLARDLPAGGALPEVEGGRLEELDEAAFALVRELAGVDRRLHVSWPETWSAWDLPEELVAQLFRGAAELYRCAPWERLSDLDVLDAAWSGERRWTICVLGNAGEAYGLNLFSEMEDYRKLIDEPEGEGLEDLAGRVVALSFDEGKDLPRPMRREISSRGWEVADPRAFPQLYTMSSPAGGLALRDAEDLLAILEALPRFLERWGADIASAKSIPAWTDEPTGVELRYEVLEPQGSFGFIHPLLPGSTEGPGAEPIAALADVDEIFEDPDAFRARELRHVHGFARYLEEDKGLSLATVERHAGNANLFVSFLVDYQWIPLQAVHELDLRTFLFDWYPRKVIGPQGEHRQVPVSLKRFFAYLADREGIDCLWARAILTDERDFFEDRLATVPGPFSWAEGMGEWQAELVPSLLARVLVPIQGIAPADPAQPGVSLPEARLEVELQRRWLLWRDELVRAGLDDPEELLGDLLELQETWQKTPQDRLEGRTPEEAIRAEREETERRRRTERARAARKGKRRPTKKNRR
ncbi:MAG: SEC-C metal-binding domain-containing protein [Thermoanaerobaculia bacterium]